MRVSSINYFQPNKISCRKQTNRMSAQKVTSNIQPNFKGEKGAVMGIVAGAFIGAIGAAVVVATGGLAGIPLGTVLVGGAGAGTHAGGILGSIIEDSSDSKKK